MRSKPVGFAMVRTVNPRAISASPTIATKRAAVAIDAARSRAKPHEPPNRAYPSEMLWYHQSAAHSPARRTIEPRRLILGSPCRRLRVAARRGTPIIGEETCAGLYPSE